MNDGVTKPRPGEASVPRCRGQGGQRRAVKAAPTVDVVVIGHTGQVGSELVARLARRSVASDPARLVFREGINRTRHLVAEAGQGPNAAREDERAADSLAGLTERLLARDRPAVVVDCSADPALPRRYPDWLRAGIGVVTPNKHGFSGDLGLYRSIRRAALDGRAPLGYSATVGAGLPILSVLRRLRQADAPPARLEAVVSGTLVHVFACMRSGMTLSSAVDDARARGFTEPDPLEDLSGRDVARKLLIMLREAGFEDRSVEREGVVDDAWAAAAGRRSDFIEALGDRDPEWTSRVQSAAAAGRGWVYLAQFGPEGARVGPARVAHDAPFVRLAGSGNLVRVALTEAPATPLEIHGPGAGVAVTAGAVLADLHDAAARLASRR